jgi:MarR family transcriptional regulator, lower aerobic nicotinate degradation pathway regulator
MTATYTDPVIPSQQQPVVPAGVARSTVLITRMARAMRRQFDEAVAPLGLRARHLVALTYLKDHGASAQQALIEAFGLDASNLVALLNELEDADLIVRRRDRADRRRGIIEISAEGERVLGLVDQALEAVDDDMLTALSDEERTTLNELLARASGPLDCKREVACEIIADECDPPDC